MKILLILGAVQFITVYSSILPPPWADPSRNVCATQPGGWLLLYWPQDGKCYRIFQKGAPCPQTMELSPTHDDDKIVGECKCPPRTAQNSTSDVCHPIYTKGPCEIGYYFAPVKSKGRRTGHCLKVEQCRQNEFYWPNTNECFPKYSRGPCPEGQLIANNKETMIAECQCSRSGPLSKYFWPATNTCHQYYTKGPCQEKGTLFLPGPSCGCYPFLPHYDTKTKRCYEIGGLGPCRFGQRFTLNAVTGQATCTCKPEHIPWQDGQCYRLYTKGPCKQNQILLQNGTCTDIPCPKGKLYFPEHDSCHRIGVRGPCRKGHLVLFEQSIKPSIEGISYRGICGCSGSNMCNSSEENIEEEPIIGRNISNDQGEQEDAILNQDVKTDTTRNVNFIRICDKSEQPAINSCYLLYTEGPCGTGEWLVPVRQGRGEKHIHRFNYSPNHEASVFHSTKQKLRVRCDCKPGYTKDKASGICKIPLITLAKYLNGEDFFR